MNLKKIVSLTVIRRLPRYYRYLSDLLQMGITVISSRDISKRMGSTASQIRQDLHYFGEFGQQGYGYNVESLHNEIRKILGLENNFQMVIIGAGHMGQALANYTNFEKRGYKLIGVFDKDPDLIGKKIRTLEVMNVDKLDEFVKNNKVDIAVITVPSAHARAIAERVASLGIKGIWNFSSIDLKVAHDVIIENVHLSDSLMVLGYQLAEKMGKENDKTKNKPT